MTKKEKQSKAVICSLCGESYSVIIPPKGVTLKMLKCRKCEEYKLKAKTKN